MIPPICLSVTKVTPSLETTKQNPCYPCNPCSKKPTHHASISIYAFPKNKIRAIRVIRVQKNYPSRININLRIPQKQNPCNSCNPCSKKPTHHASTSISVFPKNKIRAIRVIRVQKKLPITHQYQSTHSPKQNPCNPCSPPLPITESKRQSVFYLTHSTQFSITSPSLYCVICRLWFT